MILKKSLISLTVIVIMISITHFGSMQMLCSTNYKNWGTWNEIIKGGRSDDYVFLGSSRTAQHINTRYINTNLGIDAYNLGADGGLYDLHFEKLKLYLKYNVKPVNVIIGLDAESLQRKNGLHNPNQFIHVHEEGSLFKLVRSYDYKFARVKYIPLYGLTYVSPLETLSFIKHYMKPDTSDIYESGFVPVYQAFTEDFKKFKIDNPTGVDFQIDSMIIDALESTISVCLKNEINVVLVFSPSYSEVHNYINNRAEVLHIYDSLSSKYDIPFMDFSDCYISHDREYFYNSQHLNYKGATEFTRVLMTELTNTIDYEI